MTLKEAKTLEQGDEVQDLITGELTNVIKSILSLDGKILTFALVNDYNIYSFLTHKEIKLHKKAYDKR